MPFPTTRWELVPELNSGDDDRRGAALTQIVNMYSAPLLALARMDFRGRQPQDYEEMLQTFFLKSWEKNPLGRADRDKGTFRSWLITVFKNTVINEGRHATWGPTPQTNQKAFPKGGLISTSVLLDTYGPLMEPQATDTPETLFERVYQYRILTAALEEFREVCEANDVVPRYQVFVARYLDPMESRNGHKALPELEDLAREFGYASEEACGRVLRSALTEFRKIATEMLARDCESMAQAERECDLLVATFLAN
jgi:DNA-directed RNA polymerase specialized sigma24 family protein